MRNGLTILVGTFVLALAAGAVVGRLSVRALPMHAVATPPLPTGSPGERRSWLADQLGLSGDQRQRMDAIWNNAIGRSKALRDRRVQLGADREQAVRALLSPEQQSAYDAVQAKYKADRDAVDAQDDAIFHDANQRSQALLTPAQKKRWDEMQPKGGPRDWRHPHGPASTMEADAATAPAKHE